MRRRARVCIAIAALLLCTGVPSVPAQTVAPLATARYHAGLDFRVLTTGHFDILFHQGEEALAQRLRQIVEAVAPGLERRHGAPRGRVTVILVDQSDDANGWATVIPYNLIELRAVPPEPLSTIGNTDEWLKTVFAHEYTHVLHLERSGGPLGWLRHWFGRIPLAYSNLFVPGWQIEGLATYQEGIAPGTGRLAAGDFAMLVQEAARSGRFMSLDRAAGGVVDWPGGTIPYLYGGQFHRYLAGRFGAEKVEALSAQTAGRLPFLGSRAFKEVFGESLGDLWKAFERDTKKRAAEVDQPTARRRLTRHGFHAGAPVFMPDGRLLYTLSDSHAFPSVREITAGGTSSVVSRYGGHRLSAAGSLLVFDQLEISGSIDTLSDLYAFDLATGRQRRLTRDNRAADPDVAPDGRTIVCTIQETGRRALATLTLPADGTPGVPTPLLSEPDTEYYAPRWSPDGTRIVAERRRRGIPSEIVVIDVRDRAVRPVEPVPTARSVAPSWLDAHTVMFSADLLDTGLVLHSFDLRSGALRRLHGAGAGAHSATISPDGRRFVFVGYSADGYDIYELPAASLEWRDLLETMSPGPREDGLPGTAGGPIPAAGTQLGRAYSPVGTLLPRFWIPYFERDGDDTIIGGATGGFDALGRHVYALSAGWAVPRQRADIQAEYTYARWRPALFAGVSDDTDTLRSGYLRSRDVGAGALLPFRRVRWGASALFSLSHSHDELLDADRNPRGISLRRTAVRLGGAFGNAKNVGYSISREDGVGLSAAAELASGRAGQTSRGITTLVAEGRGYKRVGRSHAVVALRLAGATSRGHEDVRRIFAATGSGPQGGGFDVGLDAIGLIRGFDDADVVGRHAAVMNADVRFPIAWPQRGYGTVPLLLRSLHAAVFADAGHAWDEAFGARDMRRSAGGELSADVVIGGAALATVTGGIAWRHDPTGTRNGVVTFVRLGRAF